MGFNDEISRATNELEKFTRALQVSGRSIGVGGIGAAGGGGVGASLGLGRAAALGGALGLIGSGASAAAGAAVDAVSRVASFASPAATTYAATGSSQSFAQAVTGSLLSAVGGTSLGGLLLGGTGIQSALTTNQNAAARVGQLTEQIARVSGQSVNPAVRERLFGVIQKQERAVTEEREALGAIATSADKLEGAKPKGAGEDFDRLVSLLQNIESNTSQLPAFVQYARGKLRQALE